MSEDTPIALKFVLADGQEQWLTARQDEVLLIDEITHLLPDEKGYIFGLVAVRKVSRANGNSIKVASVLSTPIVAKPLGASI